MRRWTIGVTLALIPVLATGWVWDAFSAPLGNSLTWHMCSGDFTTAQENEIEAGAEGWTAGAGEELRGAIWSFIRGSDTASSACSNTNFSNEVYERDNTWFSSHGAPAGTVGWCLCSTAWHDIVFNSSNTWSNNVPSIAPSDSIGQVSLHEFGHSLGLNHEDSDLATMNSAYPNGGDLSGVKYHPNEDDYAGLVANRPDSSTGRNLALSKFISTGSGNSVETWTTGSSGTWTVCDYLISGSAGPEAIQAIILGTSSVSVEVRWWLSTDNDCDTGTAYVVGTRTPTIGSNVPYLITPTQYDFRGVPARGYTLCAMIDPDDDFVESSTDDDNDLTSERTLTVQDCP